jgi:uncharacterized membrane protein YkoI
MTRKTRLTAALLIVVAGAAAGCADGGTEATGLVKGAPDDVPVSLDQVPAQVRRTMEERSRGGPIQEIERSERDGQVIYEFEIGRESGGYFDIAIAEDGTVLDVEDDDDGPGDDDDGPGDDDPG